MKATIVMDSGKHRIILYPENDFEKLIIHSTEDRPLANIVTKRAVSFNDKFENIESLTIYFDDSADCAKTAI